MTDGPAPDTAMATGNDEGAPGRRGVDETPLDRQERAILAELTDSRGTGAAAVEDTPAAARAVADGTVLPVSGPPAPDDGLTPPFREPTGD